MGLGGWGAMGTKGYLMGTEFQLGMMKILWRQKVAMIAQNVDVFNATECTHENG